MMIRDGQFRKGGDSNVGGCVEVAAMPQGGIRVRDSKDHDGPLLTYSDHEWLVFVRAVKRGEFDLPD
jgi:Domain of unknown function (DUF397)